MLFATEIIHDNDLYHQWGLIGTVVGVCAGVLPALWWLLKMKSDQTVADVLKVRSSLASLFQDTVIDESLKIFDMIDEHLADSLSQVNEPLPRPSAFDRLGQDLARLDPADPNRELYRDILHSALGGAIKSEVKKFFQTLKHASAESPNFLVNPTGLRVSFDGEVERALSFIATKTSQIMRRERWYYRSLTWAFRCFVIADITGLLSLPWIFVDQKWAYWTSVTGLVLWLISILSALASLLLFHSCQTWIERCASHHNSASDWRNELTTSKA